MIHTIKQTKNHTMKNDFTLNFGKFKGQQFLSTPIWYQTWLPNQSWFKMPIQLDAMQQAQKSISKLSNSLRNWDGYSQRGAAIEGQLFEAEMRIENLLYCDCGNRKNTDEKDCGCGGIWAI